VMDLLPSLCRHTKSSRTERAASRASGQCPTGQRPRRAPVHRFERRGRQSPDFPFVAPQAAAAGV
jgi:hypothetical protein